MRATAQLRQLLKSGKTLCGPGCYNALSARIVAEVGFPAIYMTGYGTPLALISIEEAVGKYAYFLFVAQAAAVKFAATFKEFSTCAVPWLATSRTITGRALTCRSTRMRPTAGLRRRNPFPSLERPRVRSLAAHLRLFLPRLAPHGSGPRRLLVLPSDPLSRVPAGCRQSTGRRQPSGTRFWRWTGSRGPPPDTAPPP
jgi:hypothetical protein